MRLFSFFFDKNKKNPVIKTGFYEDAVDNDYEPLQSKYKPRKSDSLRRKLELMPHDKEMRIKKDLRREQLHQTIRDAFAHAGSLSASYRFKVLSLDLYEDEFVVMLDVDESFDRSARNLRLIESKVIQISEAQHGIKVKSVYWRVSRTSWASKPKNTQKESSYQAVASNKEGSFKEL